MSASVPGSARAVVVLAGCLIAASLSIASAAPALAALTATLSPASGPPGTNVTVRGTGFDPQVRVDVFLDSTDVMRAVSSAAGVVSIGIRVPRSTQPGIHWITLDEAHGNKAAQASFNVVGSWPQAGWGPSQRAWNPLENTVDASNVDQLAIAWARPVQGSSNGFPFIASQGNLYAFGKDGTLWALSPAGVVLWHSTAGPPVQVAQVEPVATPGGLIVIGTSASHVKAYPARCRTDGGVCATTSWDTNINTNLNAGLSAGLTYRAGLIYAPGVDQKVHVVKASTGAPVDEFNAQPNAGLVTQPVAFGADGDIYLVLAHSIEWFDPQDGWSGFDFGNVTVAGVAVGNGDAFSTEGSPGALNQVPPGWTQPIGSGPCPRGPISPGYAQGVVYGATCDSVGAYAAGSGNARWSISLPSFATGLAVANGVLYVCWGSRVRAYDAVTGSELMTGAPCYGAPEIAGGVLYTASQTKIYASTLEGAIATLRTSRPDPRLLLPNPRLSANTWTERRS